MKTKTVKAKFVSPVNDFREQINRAASVYANTPNKELTPEFLGSWLDTYTDNAPEDYYEHAISVACSNARTQADWSKLLHEFCGGLSITSKMPGYGWSIPASFCDAGSKLHKVQGSTCNKCYALDGRYLMPNVKLAMARRLVTYHLDNSLNPYDSNFVQVLSSFLNWNLENPIAGIDAKYFRWFDSGDLQDHVMLHKIRIIAEKCPEVSFWLPTRESGIVKRIDSIPSNLVIRYSTPMVDALSRVQNSTMVFSSLNVLPDGCQACPATIAKPHTCNAHNCRSCWTPGHIGYKVH
jgi:hypothetical protein